MLTFSSVGNQRIILTIEDGLCEAAGPNVMPPEPPLALHPRYFHGSNQYEAHRMPDEGHHDGQAHDDDIPCGRSRKVRARCDHGKLWHVRSHGDLHVHLFTGHVEKGLDACYLQWISGWTIRLEIVHGRLVLHCCNKVSCRSNLELEVEHRGHSQQVHNLVQAVAAEARVILRHLYAPTDDIWLEAHLILNHVLLPGARLEPTLEICCSVAFGIPRDVEALSLAKFQKLLDLCFGSWHLRIRADLQSRHDKRLMCTELRLSQFEQSLGSPRRRHEIDIEQPDVLCRCSTESCIPQGIDWVQFSGPTRPLIDLTRYVKRLLV
mmetsp:Transcript_88455/g.223398  ORF Transcript_88455/g.223398 Transcript_88455/m.223398 type:complete len:321 (+) Transcript_88455:256-1218(+)